MQTRANGQIIIFAKAPIAGHAKTRLIPALGQSGAAAFHKKLVHHCLIQTCQADRAQTQLHFSEAHPFFLRLAKRYRISIHAQTQGDLGLKMCNAFKSSFGPTLLIGSDCPTITPNLLNQCFKALNTHAVVILPAEDGGYGLIGLKDATNPKTNKIFENIPWGTQDVMDTTRRKLKQLHLSWSEPAIIWDIDTPADLIKLESSLKLSSF